LELREVGRGVKGRDVGEGVHSDGRGRATVEGEGGTRAQGGTGSTTVDDQFVVVVPDTFENKFAMGMKSQPGVQDSAQIMYGRDLGDVVEVRVRAGAEDAPRDMCPLASASLRLEKHHDF
jgi:hypothetical protein